VLIIYLSIVLLFNVD